MKFENEIKEKLETRRLEPSDNAWNKLEQRLSENHQSKSKKGFWWLGVAASFIGLLVVTFVFFNREAIEIPPILVETDVVETVDETSSKKQELIKNKIEVLVANSSAAEAEKVKLKTKHNDVDQSINKIRLFAKDEASTFEKIEKPIVVAQADININEKESSKETELSLDEQRINAVVAEIKRLDQTRSTLAIDDEVDSLLREAQREIAFKKLYTQAIKTVNADDLLEDIEEDLDKSFRDRVFKAVINGYNDLKTVVANRNN